ncbi:MAG: hypothetical protein ABSE89_12175 [Sedimentisphaerales bacterium]
MEPRAFLKLAKQLLVQDEDEAALRSSVSRSYYALFNLMAKFVVDNIERLPKIATDHETIRRYFNNCMMPEVKELASNLNDLRGDRNDSDYDLKSNRFQDPFIVNLIFKKAEITFNSFERITTKKENKERIVSDIQAYKRKFTHH